MQLAGEFLKLNPEGFIELGLNPGLVRFESITKDAIEQSYLWGSEASLYPWEDVPIWKSRDKKHFDMSLWYGSILCGLCYATPRASAICIKVILLEGKPESEHPLRGQVATLSLLAISRYARILGLEEIEIEEPAAGAVPLYKELGFEFDADRRLVIAVEPA
jgi:hypothetical protein